MKLAKLKITFLSLFIILLLGSLFFTSYQWEENKKERSGEALKVAQIAESLLSKDDLSKLSADLSDLEKDEYKKIKAGLSNLVSLDARIRFAYLYVQKGDKIYFLADSEPESSIDYSPPGQEYSEATQEYKQPYISGEALITKASTDRWGSWISALTPVKDSVGEVKAVLALDYPSKNWNDKTVYVMMQTVLYSLFLFILLLMLYVVTEKNLVIKENEEKFRAFSASAQDAVVIMNGLGLVVLWNKAAEKMFGYTEADILNKEFHNYITVKKEHRNKKNILNFSQSGESDVLGKLIELPVKNKSGKKFIVELSVSKVMINNSFHALGIMRDITERKKNEEILANSLTEKNKIIEESERITKLMVGRELEMLKLKKEIADLRNKINK